MARARPEELWPDHLPRDFKRKVAVYGGGYTRQLILDHPLVDDDCEIWSGNHVWNTEGWGADLPRLDRCFDVHLIAQLEAYRSENEQTHFEWLQQEHPFPVYMQEPDSRFPSAVAYPFKAICDRYFSRQYRGPVVKAAFGSMMDYITGLAVFEGADWIGYFGVEMGSSTEHQYQLPYGSLWLGICAGLGVTTWVPDDPRVQLLRHEVYAYEGFQLITAERLRQIHDQYMEQGKQWAPGLTKVMRAYEEVAAQVAEVQHGNGRGVPEELDARAMAMGERMLQAREVDAMIQGALSATEGLIDSAELHGQVSRQSLEALYYGYEKQRRDWLASSHTWVGGYRALSGQLAEAEAAGEAPADFALHVAEVGEKVRRARMAAAMAAGMMFAVKNVIEICDLKEPDLTIRAGLFEDLPMEEAQP